MFATVVAGAAFGVANNGGVIVAWVVEWIDHVSCSMQRSTHVDVADAHHTFFGAYCPVGKTMAAPSAAAVVVVIAVVVRKSWKWQRQVEETHVEQRKYYYL